MVNLELRLNGETVGNLEIDADRLLKLLQAAAAAPVVAGKGSYRSAPLTKDQAEALLERLDKVSVEFLKRIAATHGALTWGEVKVLFGVKSYEAFELGPGKEIAKATRHVLHDKSARLVWRHEHEWIGLEKGMDEACRLHIDGPALEALKVATAGV